MGGALVALLSVKVPVLVIKAPQAPVARLLLVCKVQPVTDGVQVTMASLLVSVMANNSGAMVKTSTSSWPAKMASAGPYSL